MQEAFCVAEGLPFARWAGACPGQWDAERVVFTGDGEPRACGAKSDDEDMIGRQTAEALGSYAAMIANFDATDFVVRPLVVHEGNNGGGDAARRAAAALSRGVGRNQYNVRADETDCCPDQVPSVGCEPSTSHNHASEAAM